VELLQDAGVNRTLDDLAEDVHGEHEQLWR
jgi:hypothetical protein